MELNYCIGKNFEVIKWLNVWKKHCLINRNVAKEAPNPIPGRNSLVLTRRVFESFKKGVKRNSRRSMRKMAKEPNISDRLLRRTAKEDLGINSYKIQRWQLLSSPSKRLGKGKISLEEMQRAADNIFVWFGWFCFPSYQPHWVI